MKETHYKITYGNSAEWITAPSPKIAYTIFAYNMYSAALGFLPMEVVVEDLETGNKYRVAQELSLRAAK